MYSFQKHDVALAAWIFLVSSVVSLDYNPPYENLAVDCSSDASSLWEEFVCSLADIELQPQCSPRYGIQTVKRKAKGLIVAFHGYSACPDSFDELALAWLGEGYNVMIPLLPGQGRAQLECKDAALGQVSGNCVGKDRIDSDLPLSRQGYIDFVKQMNQIVVQEKCTNKYNQVIATGLSQGGPLATYAVNTAENNLYRKLFLMNPSFGATNPPFDREFGACVNSGTPDCVNVLLTEALEGLPPDDDEGDRGAGGIIESILSVAGDSVERLIEEFREGTMFDDNTEEQKYSILQFVLRRLLTTVVENFDSLSSDAQDLVNSSVYSWGPQCENERSNGRGGICSFLTRNVIAAHSFGQYALRLAGRYDVSRPLQWHFVATERDAVSRNTLIFQASLSLQRFRETGRKRVCMYRIVCDLDGTGNECGVPHSMLSRAEQELQGDLYWIDDLIEGSVAFFGSNTAFGEVVDGVPEDANVCQLLETSSTEPAFDLALPANRGLWLRFSAVPVLELVDEGAIAQQVTDFLGIFQGQVQLVDLELVQSLFQQNETMQELYLELPATLEPTDVRNLEVAITVNGLLDQVVDASLLEVEIAGRLPRRVMGVTRLKQDQGVGSVCRGDPACFECATNNPCSADSIAANGGFYFPHCERTKFVQCDNNGGCFDMPCAPTTVWSANDNTCSFPHL